MQHSLGGSPVGARGTRLETPALPLMGVCVLPPGESSCGEGESSVVKQDLTCDAMGWLLVHPAMLPEAWQDRAISMALVPLLPDELAERLSPTDTAPLASQDARLLELVVRGLSKQRIARELTISPRTLDRRLRALREHFAVHSLTELAAAGARRGFGATPASQEPSPGGSHRK